MRRRPALALRWVLASLLLGALIVGGSGAPDAQAAAPALSGARILPLAAVASRHARVIVTYRDADPVIARALSASAMPRAAASAASAVEAPRASPRASALAARHGLALREGRTLDARSQVLMASGLSSEALVQRLAADPAVAAVQVDRVMRAHAIGTVPNDPLYAGGANARPAVGQWYLQPPAVGVGNAVAAVNAQGAWAISHGTADVVVAVLDSGVRAEHPDLVGKLLPGYDFIADTQTANDGSGRDGDPRDPGDWVTQAELTAGTLDPANCSVGDSSWHGTQTSSLIAAMSNNGIGMAGGAGHVRVLPVRVLGRCGGFETDIIDAMRWAAGLPVVGVPTNPTPARILNLSLGGLGACDSFYQAAVDEVVSRGVAVFVSAGNDGLAVDAPANCTGVIAVGGLRHAGSKGGDSNLGPQVFISAPMGNCVNNVGNCLYPMLGAVDTGKEGPQGSTYTDDFARIAIGTSFSAPLASAAAALILSVRPDATLADIKSYLRDSARPFPTSVGGNATPTCQEPTATKQMECLCTTTTCGYGMLDAGAAVALGAAGRSVADLRVSSTQLAINAANPALNETLALDASTSRAASGGALSYQWDVIEGAGLVRVNGRLDAATASLTALTEGFVRVRLTVTDAATSGVGRSSTASAVIRIGGANISVGTDATAASTGGGAMGWGWLAGLALAVLTLAWVRRRA